MPLTSWQFLLAHCITDPKVLLNRLQLPDDLLEPARKAAEQFPLRVPEPYLARIRLGDLNDPLLKQILPLGVELNEVEGFNQDPLAERQSNPVPGLIHKYQGRVLLITTGACAINCRYCFRRHFPYQENRTGPEAWAKILNYLSEDSSIKEIILSGGDPLASSDRRLEQMIHDLEKIPHLERLRIHTRLPIVIPQRVTPELCTLLKQTRLDSVIVLHSNHPNELDESVESACKQLKQAEVTLLNQAVLLRGINDNSATLKQLCEQLFSYGVLPYYLFVLDPVAGAAHFDLPDEEAIKLVSELQTQLPGYLLPRLAREIAGKPSKTLLPLG